MLWEMSLWPLEIAFRDTISLSSGLSLEQEIVHDPVYRRYALRQNVLKMLVACDKRTRHKHTILPVQLLSSGSTV